MKAQQQRSVTQTWLRALAEIKHMLLSLPRTLARSHRTVPPPMLSAQASYHGIFFHGPGYGYRSQQVSYVARCVRSQLRIALARACRDHVIFQNRPLSLLVSAYCGEAEEEGRQAGLGESRAGEKTRATHS